MQIAMTDCPKPARDLTAPESRGVGSWPERLAEIQPSALGTQRNRRATPDSWTLGVGETLIFDGNTFVMIVGVIQDEVSSNALMQPVGYPVPPKVSETEVLAGQVGLPGAVGEGGEG